MGDNSHNDAVFRYMLLHCKAFRNLIMKVAIYRTVGHLDRQFITTKFFYTWESAERFCKYVAPGLYGYGKYEFTIIK